MSVVMQISNQIYYHHGSATDLKLIPVAFKVTQSPTTQNENNDKQFYHHQHQQRLYQTLIVLLLAMR